MIRSIAIAMIALTWLGAASTAEPARELRDITDADLANWNMVTTALLTPDGEWLAYAVMPPGSFASASPGNAVVVLRHVASDLERRYEAGNSATGAGELKMSRSGKWIAFKQANGTSAQVVVLEVSSGRKVAEYPQVSRFEFIGEAIERVALQAAPQKEGEVATELTIRSWTDSSVQSFPQVGAFAEDKRGKWLAIASAKTLQLYDLTSGQARALGTAQGGYGNLTWAPSGRALAALAATGEKAHAIAVFTGIGGKARQRIFDPKDWQGFAQEQQLLSQASYSMGGGFPLEPLTWRDEEDGLFFYSERIAQASTARAGTANNLILWHSADRYLPLQKKLANEVWPRKDLSFIGLRDGRYVRLGDESLIDAAPQACGRYVLGYDPEPYNLPHAPNLVGTSRSVQLRDYYLIDLRSGARKLIVKKLPVLPNVGIAGPPRLSPDGAFVLYQDQAEYFSYEVATGRRHALTAGLPTQFYWPENSKNQRQLRDSEWIWNVFQGWSSDGRHALVSDYFDIWALPLRGGQARNMTGNGKTKNFAYQLERMGDLTGGFPEEKPLDLSQELHLQTIDYGTGRMGLSILEPRGEAPKPVFWDEGHLSFSKARDADVRIVMRMPAMRSSNYYLLDAAWQPVKALTNANPREREVRLPSGPRYLTFKTAHGDVLHAALYLPAGYVEGRSYPTIVSIYERQTSMMYGVASPGSEAFRWLLEGYALLMPDIQARVNDAGKAAVEAVTAAVEAAVATGVVDRERLGLFGHSNGGFETFFITTQSHLFKAAVPHAGWSDMLSSYGGVYERDGSPVSHSAEHEQPYIGGPWWEHWDAFIRNSPLFHAKNVRTPLLIVHGNNDQLVPFTQSVEMFNTLRRMGNTQVVLLEYDGVNHESHPVGEAGDDFEMRKREFFGHFLKGEPAPLWWTQGISYTKGQAPAPAGVDHKSKSSKRGAPL